MEKMLIYNERTQIYCLNLNIKNKLYEYRKENPPMYK